MTENHKLKSDLALIDHTDFLHWEGLGQAWTRDSMTNLMGELSCINYELSGRKLVRCLVPLSCQPQPLQCFFDHKGNAVLLRLEDVELAQPLQKLLEVLGPPEDTLTLTNNYKYAPAKQLVYASRGLAFYVLGRPGSARATLMAVALFSPASSDHYINNLGGLETLEYLEND